MILLLQESNLIAAFKYIFSDPGFTQKIKLERFYI